MRLNRDVVANAVALTRFLARHPRQVTRLRRWWPLRHAAPIDLREPFWPYAAVEFVEARLPAGSVVFEYGSGGSTLWLTDRGADVTAVEHDPVWHERLLAASPRLRLSLHEPAAEGEITTVMAPGFFDAYVAAIDAVPDASIDLVIVDGRARVECVDRAVEKVKPRGLLLLDDTNRRRYAAAYRRLGGWERHDFAGVKSGQVRPAQTSVWVRPATATAPLAADFTRSRATQGGHAVHRHPEEQFVRQRLAPH
ncbi:MAG: hypothetical protein QOJ11_407 [Frankiales bacterium]|jgi:hypothetical protein|nr:hypothetical protein [Frankiales bacterium]